MKVQELRQLLSSADRVCLEKALLECYKQLKKDQKEEFDPFLTDILTGKMTEKKKVEKKVDFSDLEQEIETFIENAYAQNYCAPNRVVPKSQRPKWRFMVKNFIKELDKIPLENENYEKAAKLLFDLYRLICYACNYYLFSTDDPFRSIGWSSLNCSHWWCRKHRLDMMEENDLWLKVYEMGIKQKIQPRENLVRAYEYRKNRN